LQGGEDDAYKDEDIIELIQLIKEKHPDCAITLSIGEKSYESYLKYYEAGADRYLLRHETANDAHYRKLHPVTMSLQNRKSCLMNLKKIGYQVGAGFMVGSPAQTFEHIAEDLIFLKSLSPQMIGIGPFISHHETPFANKSSGTLEQTLQLISIIRLMLPNVLLPSTTALGTIHPEGRELGILAGANVVMPNLSPTSVRKKYELYDNKICTGDEAAECRFCLEGRMKKIGYELTVDRGDYMSEISKL
jgi:biotin synthase